MHERALSAPAAEVGALLESLSTREDRLWPHARWPAMRLDRGLEPGSNGGHGPVRYSVGRHVPGELVEFEFTAAFAIDGVHRYEVLADGDGGVRLRHVLEGAPYGAMHAGWPLCFRWLHDALIEDSLDRAEAELAGAAWRPRPLPPHVRALRALLTRA